MQARYYDPVIGRFYSNDPVGFDSTNIQSFGRYIYGNNNPYRYTDPNGQTAQDQLDQFSETVDKMSNAIVSTANEITSSITSSVENGLTSERLDNTASTLAGGAALTVEVPPVSAVLAGTAAVVSVVNIAINSDNKGASLAVEAAGKGADLVVGGKIKAIKAISGSAIKAAGDVKEAVASYGASEVAKDALNEKINE
jgi:hypothetical protein